MVLKDLVASKRREIVETAARAFLKRAGLYGLGTRFLASAIAADLDTKEEELIGRTLMQLAPAMPEATQLPETFKRYGQTMRPWAWSPIYIDAELRNEPRGASQLTPPDDPWYIEPATTATKEGR